MSVFEMLHGKSLETAETVAHGCVLPDGRVILTWVGRSRPVTIYSTIRDFLAVHGEVPETWIAGRYPQGEEGDE